MNTNRLAQMYDRLSPWERFRLVLDAAGRGDDQELQRLAMASPREWHERRDFAPFLWALERTTAEYMMRQLDHAVCLYWARAEFFYWGKANLLHPMKKSEKLENHLWSIHRLCAFCFLRLAEAWRLFCKDLDLDPDALLEIGSATICLAEQSAGQTAFSAEEALAYIRADAPELEDMARLTAREQANGLRWFFDSELAKWEVPGTANASPPPVVGPTGSQ